MTRIRFTATWNDMPEGPHGPSIRYRAGKAYTVEPEVAERALASGRAEPADLTDPGPAAGSPDVNEETETWPPRTD